MRMVRPTMHMVFRDHAISDLIGFVYSGMPPRTRLRHLITTSRNLRKPVLDKGRDAVVLNHSRWRECVGILPEVRARVSAPFL